MKKLVSRSPEETRQAGEDLGKTLAPGSAVLLEGDLGAGKTVFAGGIANALGIRGPVKSPTFTILREYDGKYPLRHFDLYRISDPDELIEIGFESLLDGCVSVIEWPDVAREFLPKDAVTVSITRTGDEEREIIIS